MRCLNIRVKFMVKYFIIVSTEAVDTMDLARVRRRRRRSVVRDFTVTAL